MAEVPLLLLAAGDSSRMGRPKQLLPWGDHTLIEHQAMTLMGTGQPVFVVAGSRAEQVTPVLKSLPVRVRIHTRWKQGMGSSIAFGVAQVEKDLPDAEGVQIALLDQPLVTTSHFKNMLAVFKPGTGMIVVTGSGSGWQGVPVLFDRCYFEELKDLAGEGGAKVIIRKHLQAVTVVEYGDLLRDMDTPEEYERLLEIRARGK